MEDSRLSTLGDTKPDGIDMDKVLSDYIILEFKKQDSAGISTINNGRIFMRKGVGRVADVDKSLHLIRMPGHIGIGHTRWATHGAITDNNAHAHYGCTESIAIVHNGIIENHKELREELISIGHIFKSDTDSEMIVHLLEKYYVEPKNIMKAIIDTCKRLEGRHDMWNEIQ